MFYHLGFVIQFLEKYCAYSASFPLTLVFIQVRWVFLSDASASLFGASGFHFHSCYCAGQHNWTFVLQYFSYIPSTYKCCAFYSILMTLERYYSDTYSTCLLVYFYGMHELLFKCALPPDCTTHHHSLSSPFLDCFYFSLFAKCFSCYLLLLV